MSHFMPKLRDRDDTKWPEPGTWAQKADINHLATFADKLDVSKASKDADLLNSVPTPWARLLLFESALFDERHPSHREILRQWRGLLGVLGLARPLGLNLQAAKEDLTTNLRKIEDSPIAKTFLDLRPDQGFEENDLAGKKWDSFQMVSVDDCVIGATSPRTLVFTGIAHRCPPSIPFQTLNGRLTDPLAYYKKYRDKTLLSFLHGWLLGLISNVEANQNLRDVLGTVRKPEGATETSRMTSVTDRLTEWKKQIEKELSGKALSLPNWEPKTVFGLQPYAGVIKGLPDSIVSENLASDLLMLGRKPNVIVCYRPEDEGDKDARLVDESGNPVQNEFLRLYEGWWHETERPLPNPLHFVPTRFNAHVINDPVAELFEEDLLQVRLPQAVDSVHVLRLTDQDTAKTYLYPFKETILNLLDGDTIALNTTIATDVAKRSVRVALDIPLANGRKIRASRDYAFDTHVVKNPYTAELASWPSFASGSWHDYLYFKNRVADPEIDFKPTTGDLPREYQTGSWYRTDKPVEAFVGTFTGKSGLLLLRYGNVEAVTTHWKISVDFGSTHTRVFYLPMERTGENEYTPRGDIQPLEFSAQARALTLCRQLTLDTNFLPTIGRLQPPTRKELKSLLMTPMPVMTEHKDWLPREGFLYMHWLFELGYDQNHIKDNIKWEENRTKIDVRAFLRCLVTMIQAEAAKRGAEIVSISRAFPTAFTASLVQQHKEEWDKLGEAQKIKIDPALSEAVATCRYLEAGQNAPAIDNAISLDVGGSTTDIAIWAGNVASDGTKKVQLVRQESVKMAAGIVGRYLQSPNAEGFVKAFAEKMREYSDSKQKLDLGNFVGTQSGNALLFYSFLSFLELKKEESGTQALENVIDWIKTASEIEGNGNKELISHITFLFVGLVYYVGLLARRVNLHERSQNTYRIYFCGKGGSLVKWVNGFDQLAQTFFEAGLFGASGRGGQPAPKVSVYTSDKPKQEVGRGLLARSRIEADSKQQTLGVIEEKEYPVTAAETGYQSLNWDEDLDSQKLSQLPLDVPQMGQLQEVQNFIRTFKDKDVRTTFDLDLLDADEFRAQLKQRLFVRNKGEKEQDRLVEPLLITELKVLQELVSKNSRLFE